MSSGLFFAHLVVQMNGSCLNGVAGVSQEAVPCKWRFLRGYDFERHMSRARKGLHIQVSFATKGNHSGSVFVLFSLLIAHSSNSSKVICSVGGNV